MARTRDNVFLKQIGARVRQLREREGVSQEHMANRIGMERAQYAALETGRRNPTANTLRNLFCGLGVTPRQFFDCEAFEGPSAGRVQHWRLVSNRASGSRAEFDLGAGSVDVPLLGTIAAGRPDDPVMQQEVRAIPAELHELCPTGVLLAVSGESMNRTLPNGALVLVEPCSDVDVMGWVYAFSVNGETTLKRGYVRGRSLVLEPDSDDPSFLPQRFGPRSRGADEVRVLGKARWVLVP